MNHNMRDRITAEAATRADRYPVDVARATDFGTRKLRKRYLVLILAAVLVVAALSVGVLMWRAASGAPAWGPFAPASQTTSAVTVVSVRVTPQSQVLVTGASAQLSAIVLLSDGSVGTLNGGSWTSSDTGVVTVDSHGRVAAIGPGEATITVSVNEVTSQPVGVFVTS